MRYIDWEVSLRPTVTNLPLPEFKIEAQSVNDYEAPIIQAACTVPACETAGSREIQLPPIYGQMPMLTAWVPSQRTDIPFRVVIGRWTQLYFAADLERMKAAGRTAQLRVRVFIDERVLCDSAIDATMARWPMMIETCDWVRFRQYMGPVVYGPEPSRAWLTWPAYEQQRAPGQDRGRIKVLLSEGFMIQETRQLVWQRNLVAFCFQQAPLEILRLTQIAWPREEMWRKPEFILNSWEYGAASQTFFRSALEAGELPVLQSSNYFNRALSQSEVSASHAEWVYIAGNPVVYDLMPGFLSGQRLLRSGGPGPEFLIPVTSGTVRVSGTTVYSMHSRAAALGAMSSVGSSSASGPVLLIPDIVVVSEQCDTRRRHARELIPANPPEIAGLASVPDQTTEAIAGPAEREQSVREDTRQSTPIGAVAQQAEPPQVQVSHDATPREDSPMEGPPAKRTRSHYTKEGYAATTPVKSAARTPSKATARTPTKATPRTPAKTPAKTPKTARKHPGAQQASAVKGKAKAKTSSATLRPIFSQPVHQSEDPDDNDDMDAADTLIGMAQGGHAASGSK